MLTAPTFTEEEEKLIKLDRRKGIPMSMGWGRKFLFFVLVVFTATNLYAMERPVVRSSCSLFPSTWKCKCGYDNYEGINNCAICGKAKGSK